MVRCYWDDHVQLHCSFGGRLAVERHRFRSRTGQRHPLQGRPAESLGGCGLTKLSFKTHSLSLSINIHKYSNDSNAADTVCVKFL